MRKDKKLDVRLDAETLSLVQRIAEREDVSASHVVRVALRAYLAEPRRLMEERASYVGSDRTASEGER